MRLGVVGGGDLRSAFRALVLRKCLQLLAEGCEGGHVGWKQLGTLRLGMLQLGRLRLGRLQWGSEEGHR